MGFRNAAKIPYRVVLAGERAAGALSLLCALFLLVGLPSILPQPLLPIGVGAWMKSFSHAEQAVFDRVFPPLAGMPVAIAGIIGALVGWPMFGITRRLRSVRIKAEARLDARPAVLLLRSFTDTALQESPSRINPLAIAASLAVLPFPLAQFAFTAGEERALINTMDQVFSDTARVLMLKPRGVKSAFTLFSRHLEIDVVSQLWERAFLLLARSSKAVLLMPSATAGVMREVDILKSHSDLLARTVVVLPPVETRRFTWYGRHPARGWPGVQEAWRASALNLPPYPDAGMAYVPNLDFSVNRAISLKGTFGGLAEAVADLVPSGERSVPTSAAIAGIDALTGRSDKWKVLLTAAVISLLTPAILTTSATLLWTEWKKKQAAEQALIYKAAERVIEGNRTLTTRIRLDPQLALALALYAWDHAKEKPPVVVKALLAATQNSIFESAPDWSSDSEKVRAVVPQDTGALMAESDFYLRRFTVTPSLKKTFEKPRYKFCINGEFAIGTSGSLVIACDDTRTIMASYTGGKPEIVRGFGKIRAIAIEGKRVVWADASNQIVFMEEGREAWRTTIGARISQILMSPDGRFAWVQGAVAGVLIDLDRRARVFSRQVQGNRGAGFSPSSHYFIEGASLHDLTTGTLREAGSDEQNTVEAVTSDGLLIAIGHANGVLEIADGNGPLPIARLDAAFRSLRFFGNTRRLAAGAGNQVLVFDVEAALKLRPLLKLLESKAKAREDIKAASEVREIDEQLGLVRGRTRKLTTSECEKYLDTNACPEGLCRML